MSQEKINNAVSERICKHMNTDHQDAVKSYALYYGGIKNFKKVIMISLNSHYMELEVDERIININFDHILQDSKDAHKTLVSMLKSIPKENSKI
tara:strand:- start:116 stop:397 length:282 start_codon:yes stop_codon:yes gene_type:complete